MTPNDRSRITREIRSLLPEPVNPNAPNAKLGKPMDVRAVARLIGCSVETVRRSLVRQGLPCFRTGPHGRLVFFKDQVVRWIERAQRDAGGKP